jgi:N6-L-threonylcarbamoyladenine synthase
MKILAIETSCDDTGIAILDVKGTKTAPIFSVLSNIVASQVEMGKKYGGVFPAMAKREHQKNLVPTFIKALEEAKLLNPKAQISKSKKIPNSKTQKLEEILEREPELKKQLIPFLEKNEKPDVDLISVTNGPGLEPCLWVGVNFAKTLSYIWDIPVVPVNHIESHILVNLLPSPVIPAKAGIQFPAVALVVSGGHTQIILVEKIGKYKILGETRDDAAGECFDKCAKILGLEYPGGPVIAKLAEKGEAGKITLPRPMINTKDYDFSFSGLKTAVLYSWTQQNKNKKQTKIKHSKEEVIDMAAEIQQAIVDVLIKKTVQAAKDYNARTIILGGGVSANHELKTQLIIKMHEELPGVEYLFPQIDHSTDNGLMTAITGYFHQNKKIKWQDIKAESNLRIGQNMIK